MKNIPAEEKKRKQPAPRTVNENSNNTNLSSNSAVKKIKGPKGGAK